MPDLQGLTQAVKMLGADLETNGERINEQNRLLAEQNKKLDSFVPKGRFRWAVGGVVLIVLAILAVILVLRHQDRDATTRRVEGVRAAAVATREQNLAGCARGNDLRADLRRALSEVIERAYGPQPVPDGLSPELAALFAQAQQRAAQQKVDQLAALKAQFQPVNCEQAYPPINLDYLQGQG